MRWKYDGYTKIKVGRRMVENHIYICPDCHKSIRIEHMIKPPMLCPNCGADMRGEQNG